MVNSHNERGIGGATLDQSGSLLQGNQPRNTGERNALHWTARAVVQREIGRQKVSLQVTSRSIGARTSRHDSFQRFDICFGRGKHESDALCIEISEMLRSFAASLT